MATVEIWTGVEVRALRQAKRMSIEAFAAHLGVSDRMVSKWEARGASIQPRPVNQAALDTSLAAPSPDAHERFARPSR
ncbi:helix-turn-helix domain-containing protein [Streptomyces sp. NBC_01803]|uniref:helix-turn-helix domain-containing protein n=1 Tax=Streptomyces sp. NBC_01803 TaxID=2975946 RepID=UPI002DD7B600|nr:helix-turn-helix domain-containing protein [Streptomyces sp. NBC_01803]WSA45455.1 helix-turn-helix domain-containing protein [Streptomyces sp. NBC_01803]